VADDIVTRLRGWVDRMDPSLLVLTEAADEIERLRAAGDALAECLRYWADFADEAYPDRDALRTWEEARRG
jgi:hypothetical protein